MNTVPYFPYKIRIAKYKDRYVKAYEQGLDTIGDWLFVPNSDIYTPSRQALADKCVEVTGIPHWHFMDGCSVAMQAALSVVSKPGDRVLVPAWCYVGVALQVSWIHRKPVFVDVGHDALMDRSSVVDALNKYDGVAVINPVHQFGRVQDIETLVKGLPDDLRIIEDAANAFWMGDPGVRPGIYSDICCYSFDLAKNPAGTGTGGGVSTHNKRLMDRMREVTQQGYNKDRSGFVEPAFKTSLDDTTARCILEDWAIMEENKSRDKRRENNEFFKENIDRTQLAGDNTICMGFGFFPERASADEARKIFREAGITVAAKYPYFPEEPQFSHFDSVPAPYAKRLSRELVTLPLHEYITEEQRKIMVDIANSL